MLQSEVISTGSPEIVNNTPTENSNATTPVVSEVVNTPTEPVVSKPIVQNVQPDPLEKLKKLHTSLQEDMDGVPTDFVEFQKALTPEKLQKVYDYTKQKYDGVPDSYDEFAKAVGFVKLPGIDKVNLPKQVPLDLLRGSKFTFSDILTKEVPQYTPTQGLTPTDEVKNAWEYIGNLAGKFNEPILKTLEYIADLKSTVNWAMQEPQTMNPFHTITEEETGVFNSIKKDNRAILQWLRDKGVGGEGQKALPGKDVPTAVNAVEFPMRFENVHEEGFVSQGMSSLATVSGELIQMATTPSIKAGKFMQTIGMEYLPKAPMFFGFLGVRDSDNSHWYSPYKGFAEGVINGIEMDALGGLAGKWGKDIAKVVMNGGASPFVEQFSVMGMNAALFAGDDVVKQLTEIGLTDKEMKDFDPNRTGQSAFMGVGMGMFGTTKGAFSSFVEARGRQVRANMMNAWMTTEKNVGQQILKSNISPEQVRARIDELNTKIANLPKESGEVIVKATAERNLLNTVISYSAQAKEIIRDPEGFKATIKNDPNIPENAKQFLYNKVEETLQAGDPTYAKADRIQAEMTRLNESITAIEADVTLTPEKMEAKKAAALEQVGKLKTDLKDVYSKESFWLNGKEFNSESEFRAEVSKAKTANDLTNAIVRNNPKAAEWVKQKQLDMATDEIKYGIRSQELLQQDVDVDARILEFQGKTGSSELPDLIVPDRVNTIIDRIDRGETIPVEHAQEASNLLYGEYKRLESLKQSNDPVIKRHTTEQIEKAQEFLENEIINVENYVDRTKGGNAPNRTEVERIKAERERVQAAKDAELAKQVQDAQPTGGAAEAGSTGVSQEGVEIMLTPKQPKEVDRTQKEKGNLVLAAGVDEVSAFLGDRKFNGETPSVDRAVTEMAKELSTNAKTSEEVFQGVKDALSKSVEGNDWATKQVERLVNDRVDMIKETFEGLQPSTETALNRKGETTNLRGEINKIRTEEKSYRETLKEQLASEIQAAKERGEYVTTAGLSAEELNLYAKLASSYIREGVKTTKAVFDAVNTDIKGITGKSIKREDFDTMMEHTPKGETSNPRDLLDVYDEIRTRGKQETIDKGKKTPEQLQIEKDANIRKERTKVLVDEYAALKDEIKLQQKTALEVKKSEQASVTENVDRFKAWVGENKKRINELAPELSTTLMNKIASVKDAKSLENAISYTEDVFTREKLAKHAAEIIEYKKKALTNLKNGRFGNEYDQVSPIIRFGYKEAKAKYEKVQNPVTGEMERLLTIGEANIPDKYIPAYTELLKKMAGKGELDVNGTEVRNLMDVLQDELNRQINKKLLSMDKSYKTDANPDKVKNINDVRWVERGITYSQIPIIDKIDSRLFSKDEQGLFNEMRKFTPEDLDALGITQLRKARLILEHAKDNGWLSNRLYNDVILPVRKQKITKALSKGFDIIGQAKSLGEFKDTKQFLEVTNLANDLMSGKIKHEDLTKKLSTLPVDQLDRMLGGGITTPIYKAIHHTYNAAIARSEMDITKVDEGMDGLITRVLRESGSSELKKMRANTRMSFYALEREALANKGNGDAKVKPLDVYIKNVVNTRLDPESIKVVQDLYNEIPKNAEGRIDIDYLYNTMMNGAERNLVTYVDNIGQNHLLPMARFSEVQYRGGAFSELKDYVHRVSSDVNGKVDNIVEGRAASTISARASATNERVGTEAVSFDYIGNFRKNVREVIMDYHLTPTVKETFGALRELKDQYKGDQNAQQFITSLHDIYDKNVRIQTAGGIVDNTVSEGVIKAVLNGSYNNALASMYRVPNEMFSNVLSAMMYDPKAFMLGEKLHRQHPTAQWEDVIYHAGSTHMNRIGPQNEFVDMLSGGVHRLKSNIGESLDARVVNFANHNKVREVVNNINKGLISISDQTIVKRYWKGKFSTEFTRFAKQEFSMDKFENDPTYRNKYDQAIKDAGMAADYHTTLLFNSPQSFDRKINAKSMPGHAEAFKKANNFLVGYGNREWATTMLSLKAIAYDNQGISKWQAAKLLTTLAVRNTVYGIMRSQLAAMSVKGLAYATGVDPEEDEQTAGDVVKKGTLAGLGGLVLGKWGTYARIAGAYVSNGLYYLANREEGEDYDPVKHSIMYTQGNILAAPRNPKSWFSLLGPATYVANTLYDGASLANKVSEEVDGEWLTELPEAVKEKDIQMQALNFGQELLSLGGVLPVPRDVKMVTNFLQQNADEIEFGKSMPSENNPPIRRSVPRVRPIRKPSNK